MCKSVIDWAAVAAWVQAVGAIIALFVAVGLPLLQDRQKRRQLRGTLRGLAEQAIARVDWLIAIAQQKRIAVDLRTLRLGEITGLMARLQIDQLEPDDIVVVLEFSGVCRRLTDFWNQRMEDLVNQGVPGDTSILEEAKAELIRLRGLLK